MSSHDFTRQSSGSSYRRTQQQIIEYTYRLESVRA